jgi:putative FmdB family regulatory protein
LPLYEYECKKCKRRMEKIRKFSDPPLTVCEKCGGKLEQLISSPAIQFKGAGWYVTDYAKKSSVPSSSSSSDDSSSSSEKKEKAEAKADAKSDAKSGGKSEAKSEAKGSKKSSEPAKASSSKE